MAWNSTWPAGTQSVKTNQATGAANTTYIKTTMNQDHYWDNSGNNDGHHLQVQMTQSGTAAVPVDVTLATGMDGAIFSKAKSAVEAPVNQDVQPFFVDNKVVATPGLEQVMQILAMRAVALFDVHPTTFVITPQYYHNITSVTRQTVGQYTLNFADNFPSVNYLAQGGGVRAISPLNAKHGILWMVKPTAVNLSDVKTVAKLLITFTRPDDTLVDPIQGWCYAFGG